MMKNNHPLKSHQSQVQRQNCRFCSPNILRDPANTKDNLINGHRGNYKPCYIKTEIWTSLPQSRNAQKEMGEWWHHAADGPSTPPHPLCLFLPLLCHLWRRTHMLGESTEGWKRSYYTFLDETGLGVNIIYHIGFVWMCFTPSLTDWVSKSPYTDENPSLQEKIQINFLLSF